MVLGILGHETFGEEDFYGFSYTRSGPRFRRVYEGTFTQPNLLGESERFDESEWNLIQGNQEAESGGGIRRRNQEAESGSGNGRPKWEKQNKPSE